MYAIDNLSQGSILYVSKMTHVGSGQGISKVWWYSTWCLSLVPVRCQLMWTYIALCECTCQAVLGHNVSQLGMYTSLLTISVSTQVVYPQMNVLTVLCLCLGTGISGCGQDYYPRRWHERLLLAGAVQLFPPQASNISAVVILRYNLGNSLACIRLFGNKYVHFKTAYRTWQ